MKFHSLLLFLDINFLIIINNISYYLSGKISSTIPLYKIILSEDISHLEINYLYNLCIEIKGQGIIFNNDSDISVMPLHILKNIYEFYKGAYDDMLFEIKVLPNKYNNFTIVSSLNRLETIHFILEEKGISFPLNKLFIPINKTNHLYGFRFLGKEEEENIIFGKDLIKDMNVNFEENENKFTIYNKDFITKIEDE